MDDDGISLTHCAGDGRFVVEALSLRGFDRTTMVKSVNSCRDCFCVRIAVSQRSTVVMDQRARSWVMTHRTRYHAEDRSKLSLYPLSCT
jgi:hypothetical protein